MSTTEQDACLKKALAENRPGEISRVLTRFGIDSTGDRAVWIWVILKDGSLLEEGSRSRLDAIRRWAQESARSAVKEWAFVAFRTEEEQQEVEAKTK